MPFFHDQDRSGLRRHYLEAWRRHRARLLEDDEGTLGRDYTPESGQSNPFLHLGLHLAIREQVATDRPAGIAAVHRELSRRLGDVHEAEHRMLERLGEALWLGQRTGRPPDEAAYLESLRRLLGPAR